MCGLPFLFCPPLRDNPPSQRPKAKNDRRSTQHVVRRLIFWVPSTLGRWSGVAQVVPNTERAIRKHTRGLGLENSILQVVFIAAAFMLSKFLCQLSMLRFIHDLFMCTIFSPMLIVPFFLSNQNLLRVWALLLFFLWDPLWVRIVE